MIVLCSMEKFYAIIVMKIEHFMIYQLNQDAFQYAKKNNKVI